MKKVILYTMVFLLIAMLTSCKQREVPASGEESSQIAMISEAPEVPRIPEPEETDPEEELVADEESGEEESQEEESSSQPQASSQSESESAQQGSQEQASEEQPPQESGEVADSPQDQDNQAETSVSTVAESTYVDNPTIFNYSASQVSRMYVHNHRDYTYVPVDAASAEQILAILKSAGNGSPQELYAPTEGGLFVILQDGTKFSYTLLTNAVRVGQDSYSVSPEQYEVLKGYANAAISNGPAYAQWLIYMTPARVSQVTYHSDSTGAPVAIPSENTVSAASTLANIQVRSGSGNAYSELKALNKEAGNLVIQLHFDAGITYTLLVQNGTLYIQSSDMNYGIYYQSNHSQASIEAALASLCA